MISGFKRPVTHSVNGKTRMWQKIDVCGDFPAVIASSHVWKFLAMTFSFSTWCAL